MRSRSVTMPAPSPIHHHKGFTLIELLVAIGIIGILSSIVIVAISPEKQITDARDAERRSNVKQIDQAIQQKLIDDWVMPGNGTIPTGLANAKPICRAAVTGSTCTTAGGADLSGLVPDFIAQMPVDVVMATTSNCTGYMVYQENGRSFVLNPNMGKLAGDAPAAESECGVSGGGGGSSSAAASSAAASSAAADSTPPTILSLTPADNATNVTVTAPLIIEFNEPITIGTGANNKITVRRGDNNSLVEEIILDSNLYLPLPRTSFTINRTVNLTYNYPYYVQIGADVFDDAAGNAFPGFSDTTTWNFTAQDEPEMCNCPIDQCVNDSRLHYTCNPMTDICELTTTPSGCTSVTAVSSVEVNDPSNGGNISWFNLSAVHTSDDDYAAAVPEDDTTVYLKTTGYGFNIPVDATITGITVSVEKNASVVAQDQRARLVFDDTVDTFEKRQNTDWPTTDTVVVYGGENDLWSHVITPATINSSGFGFAISGQIFGIGMLQIDRITIKVTYFQ